MGYNIVIFPVTLQRVALRATQDALRTLKAEQSQMSFVDNLQTREELYDLLGYSPEEPSHTEPSGKRDRALSRGDQAGRQRARTEGHLGSHGGASLRRHARGESPGL